METVLKVVLKKISKLFPRYEALKFVLLVKSKVKKKIKMLRTVFSKC